MFATTLMYDHIRLYLKNCEDDLTISLIPSKGIIQEVEHIEYLTESVIYKLCAPNTYVIGPHATINSMGYLVDIETCYNIYKVRRILKDVPPYIIYWGYSSLACHLLEVDVKQTNNRFEYYDYLYGG